MLSDLLVDSLNGLLSMSWFYIIIRPQHFIDSSCIGLLKLATHFDIAMNIIAERRALNERRQRTAGPPRGSIERRRRVERRLPSVEEHAISDADWQLLFGTYTQNRN